MAELAQKTGIIGFRHGDFRMNYENDGGAVIKHLGLGDKGDSYRTAAFNISIGDFSAGINLFTGYRDLEYEKKTGMSDQNGIFPRVEGVTSWGRKYPRGFVAEIGDKYRLGAAYIGWKNFRIGTDSEHVRHAIQDRFIHGLIKDGGFKNQSWKWNPYFQSHTKNKFTSW